MFYVSRFIASKKRTIHVFKSKRLSLLTIFALVVTSLSGLSAGAASAAENEPLVGKLTVNGVDLAGTGGGAGLVAPGTVVLIPQDTKSADVVIETTPNCCAGLEATIDGKAISVVNNIVNETISNLSFGDHTLAFRIYDTGVPATTRNASSIILRVAPMLSSLTVDGVAVADGAAVDLAANTKSVEVVAAAVDANATVTITGATELSVGANELEVTVVDSNNVTGVYSVTLNVPASENTSAVITINGEAIQSSDNLTVPWGTKEVAVEVQVADENATYFVTGELGLETGDNVVTVIVTAADNETSEEYTFYVEVLPNTDTSVNFIKINGTEVVDGDEIDVEPLSTEIGVEVDTVDTDATVEIIGDSELVVGGNLVSVIVTAADEATTKEYQFTVNVLVNTDASVLSINVAGFEVGDADFVTVPPLTSEVEVIVELTDPDATYEVEGGVDLLPGDNDLLITVTAADGETSQEYFVTITVLPNTDTSLSTLDVNGESALEDSVIEVPAFTEEVTVDVITTDELASFVVDGNEGLVVGENTVTVIVTAADDSTTEEHLITVIVAPSNDASLASLSVVWTGPDGEESATASEGDVIDLPAGTKEVEIAVEPTDAEATYEISGGSELVLGANELVVVITAADGEATETINVVLNVLPSSDATFSGMAINGKDWVDGQVIEVDAGDLDIQVARNNEFANILVTPSGGARTVERDGFGYIVASGFAELQIDVTAQDGETVESATVLVWASSSVSVVPNSGPADAPLRVGTFVKLPRGQFDLAAKLTYTWLRDGEEVGEGSKYLLTAEDYGKDVRPLISVTKKGVAPYSILGKAFEVSQGLLTKAPVPSIKGKAIVANTLTSTTKDWIEGAELAYQWYRDGEAIDGADSDSYDLTGYDAETKITVGITGTLEGYESIEKVSLPVTVALGTLKYEDKPLIEGSFVTGGILEVNPGTWLEEAEVTIDWIRDGDVFYTGAADENTYELDINDFQSKVGVRINVSAIGYKSTSFTIKSRVVKQGTFEAPTPVVTGDAVVGETLLAETGEYPEGTEFSYAWKRNGRVVQGFTTTAFTLNTRDLGTTISVKVIAKIPGYKTVRIDSDGVDITPAQ
jgi:hypothetical protein